MICPSCQAHNEDIAENCFKCGKGLYALTEGSVVSSRYEILNLLGKGGMGMVYKAFDRELEETVAIKVLRSDIAGSPDFVRRFRSEIKLARKVSHRNVCRIHEYGRDGHLSYIVMEYIEGIDLKRIVRQRGALMIEEGYDVAIQVAKALQAIHDVGIVHRDLKTPNIMKDSLGIVKLMDFGIAKSFESLGTTSATATGLIVGTPEYMSPEQAAGEKVDTRADIYTLGVVIYELFTGNVPFRGDSPIATLLKQIQEPPPLAKMATLPAPLVPVLTRALAKSREDRFGTAREMAEALKQARAVSLPGTKDTPAPLLSAAVPMPEPIAATTPMPTPVPTSVPTAVPTVAARPPVTTPAVPPHAVAASRRPRPATPSVPATRRRAGFWLWGAAVGGFVFILLAGGLLLVRPQPIPEAAVAPTGVAQESAGMPEMLPSPVSPVDDRAAAGPPAPVLSAQPNPSVGVPARVAEQPKAPTPRPAAPNTTPSALPPRPVSKTEAVTAPVAEPPTAPRDGPAVAPMAAPQPQAVSNEAVPEREAKGLLQVGVRPFADVTVDGAPMGTTPIRAMALSPGVHTVRLTHPDYQPFLRKVTIRARETTKLTVDLSLDGIPK